MDQNPLDARMYGPEGWTAPLVELLSPYLLGDDWYGIREFAGVPVDVARRVAELLERAGVEGVEGPSGREVVEAAAAFGPGATVTGRTVDSSRGDERVEFTAAQVDVTGWDDERVAGAVAHQLRSGRYCELDEAPGQRRLTVSW